MPHEYDPKTLGYLADHLRDRTFSQESQRILDLLKPHGKPAWLPVTEDGEGDPQGSRYFGRPWLLESEEWPTTGSVVKNYRPRPLVFVLQINLETLPIEAQKILGSTGLFQFFYDAVYGDAHFARVIALDQPGGLRNVPEEQLNTNLFQDCKGEPLKFTAKSILRWVFREDFPGGEEFSQMEPSYDRWTTDPEDLYGPNGIPYFQHIFSFAEDKLVGWPLWLQSVEYPMDSLGEKMVLVFSFTHSEHGSNNIVSGATGRLFKSKTLSEFNFLVDGT